MKKQTNKTYTIVIKRVKKGKEVYYNFRSEIEGMTLELEPKFLNRKQLLLLRHKLARAMGDEKNGK